MLIFRNKRLLTCEQLQEEDDLQRAECLGYSQPDQKRNVNSAFVDSSNTKILSPLTSRRAGIHVVLALVAAKCSAVCP
jgi:hypothetical protein